MNKLANAVVTLLKSQPSSVRNRRRRRRRNGGNASRIGGFKRAITAPLSVRPQGFGPSRMSVNCTFSIPATQFSNITSFKLSDVLDSTQEFQTYSPRFEVFKYLMFGVTVYPASVLPSGASCLYILNRWSESSLIDATSIVNADGVKTVPANLVRPKTFSFLIENYESNSYNLKSWHDVNNNGAQSWLYFYSGSINTTWSVRFDVRVAFAQPVPMTMPTKKLPAYTVINGKRILVDEDLKDN